MVAVPQTATNKLSGKQIKSKNQYKREKAKLKKATTGQESTPSTNGVKFEESEDEMMLGNGDVEYVFESLEVKDAALDEFSNVFARFKPPPESTPTGEGAGPSKGDVIYSDDDMPSDGEDSETGQKKTMSKKKQRKASRLTVAELKQLVNRPEVVDWYDPSAADPRLLIALKSYRNTVPIPQHWNQKRDYLQGKRGIEKAPFQLPAYIADTGIATIREAVKEKEASMSLKAKTRERVQPKMGKVDIDYQKLHDAFFKHMTKPPTTGFGEMYYEGKEFETSLKEKRPGDLSPELIEALSIPPLAPPPWLISMQRFGPPPSYPTLRIPGLNAPLPQGAQWGFHPGGWGKPPMDEYNRPLYGDVFGVLPKASDFQEAGEPIEREAWGELEPEEGKHDQEDESSEEEEEEEGEEEQVNAMDGLQTPSGMETPSGMTSVVSTVAGGLETPDFLDLRKSAGVRAIPDPTDSGPKQLYQVVPERQTAIRGLMGSERGYDVAGLAHGGGSANVPVLGQEQRGSKRKGGVEVSIDASELEGMSEDQLKRHYAEASRSGTGNGVHVPGGREDFSDMVVENTKKQRQKQDNKKREKEKDFKF